VVDSAHTVLRQTVIKRRVPVAKATMKISASAFNRSLELALRCPPDPVASTARITRAINRLPRGTIYSSNNGKTVGFYVMEDRKQRHIPKCSSLIHPLARKRYLSYLQELLELVGSSRARDIQRCQWLLNKIQNLITTFEKGGLNLEKIVLTSQQYQWFTNEFAQKRIDKAKARITRSGVPVRSKSERDIHNQYENLAVPIHYEEQLLLFVKPLVDELEQELTGERLLRGLLYDYIDGDIYWNVPPEYEWMNAQGSIWKTYHPPTGRIRIFNDFKTMFADGSVFIHEHAGMMRQFRYRCNETERIAVMKITGTVDEGHFLETYEENTDTPEQLISIIEKHVLPKLWF